MMRRKSTRTSRKSTHRAASSDGAAAAPQRRRRQAPGTGGGGEYFHVGVRPKERFVTFRTQDVGEPGHIQRVAGKRSGGSWDTVKWLISKEDAHKADGKLVADTAAARKVLNTLGSRPVLVKGDAFTAKPRRDVPESRKPTAAQRRARGANIQKAQAARHGGAGRSTRLSAKSM